MAGKQNYSTKEITDMLVQSILELPHFSKQELESKILPIIKHFTHQAIQPNPDLKFTDKKVGVWQKTIIIRDTEKRFYRDKLKELHPELIQKYDDEIHKIVKGNSALNN